MSNKHKQWTDTNRIFFRIPGKMAVVLRNGIQNTMENAGTGRNCGNCLKEI